MNRDAISLLLEWAATPQPDWAPQACTRAIGCPKCGAAPGQLCNTDRPLHLERWDAWAAAGYAKPGEVRP